MTIASSPNGPPSSAARFPLFRPYRLLTGGHVQTVAGAYLHGAGPYREAARRAAHHEVPLSDGDRLVLHDDRPEGWRPGDPAALLMHGLSGCGNSTYILRAAGKLGERGVRAFRMDCRTAGAGRGLSRRTYHAGLGDDVLAALAVMIRLCPESSLGLVGYSMGGNMLLKALGDRPDAVPAAVTRAVAVNPAIDLAACCDYLTGPLQGFYDRRFARTLTRHAAALAGERVPEGDAATDQAAALEATLARATHDLIGDKAARIRDFDARYTVPRWGFGSLEDYYRSASSVGVIRRIGVPTLLLHSRDDPLVPGFLFETLDRSPAVSVHLTEHGGHLGFIGVSGVDPDRRWMDWRVVDWLTGTAGPDDVPASSPRRPWRPELFHRPPEAVG